MSFADDLRNTKPLDPKKVKITRIKYMCNMISTADIKAKCSAAARRGARYAVVEKDNFYLDSGTSFSVDFTKKFNFKLFRSADDDLISKAVSDTLGQTANELGLNLDSVVCRYSSNGDAPDSYNILAKFSW